MHSPAVVSSWCKYEAFRVGWVWHHVIGVNTLHVWLYTSCYSLLPDSIFTPAVQFGNIINKNISYSCLRVKNILNSAVRMCQCVTCRLTPFIKVISYTKLAEAVQNGQQVCDKKTKGPDKQPNWWGTQEHLRIGQRKSEIIRPHTFSVTSQSYQKMTRVINRLVDGILLRNACNNYWIANKSKKKNIVTVSLHFFLALSVGWYRGTPALS